MPETRIETQNDFLFGTRGDVITYLLQVPSALSKDEALRLAAWLVVMADPTAAHDQFQAVLEAVENT